ncbi:MAG: HisA/HisF-related TIM barrel protein [Planctomycetales bacterium]
MLVLPVLDLLEGVVVRGVAGKRQEYRPVESALAADSRPLTVARAFRERLGLDEFYVADLDAILHDRPGSSVLRELAAEGFRLHVDAGLRDAARAQEVLAAGAQSVVAGLETLSGPEALREIVAACGAERVIFSLDLHAGAPLGVRTGWHAAGAIEIAALAAAAGIHRLLVLDLAGIGLRGGISTLPLCGELRRRYASWEMFTGGGARSAADLRAARDTGLDGALVATALHEGWIARDDVRALRSAARAGRAARGHTRELE